MDVECAGAGAGAGACSEQFPSDVSGDQGLFTKIKESSLSISLTAALILVASVVVIISSITIQSAYMWLAVGGTAVLFLGFCSCTTCEKGAHLALRRGSVRSDSVSTVSDGRDNFYEVGHVQPNAPYWMSDLPPSYAAATAIATVADCTLPPPYAAVAGTHIQATGDALKPPISSTGADTWTGLRANAATDTMHPPSCPCSICYIPAVPAPATAVGC